jgi:hypothetical protein
LHAWYFFCLFEGHHFSRWSIYYYYIHRPLYTLPKIIIFIAILPGGKLDMAYGTRQILFFSLWWGLALPPYVTVLVLFYMRRTRQPIKARFVMIVYVRVVSCLMIPKVTITSFVFSNRWVHTPDIYGLAQPI